MDDAAQSVTIDITGAHGDAVVQLARYFAPGDRIHEIRVTVSDNTITAPVVGYSGPTRLVARLRSQLTPSAYLPVADSAPSDGSGRDQVLTISDLDIAASGLSLQTLDYIGVGPCEALGAEIDYSTAP